MNDEARDLKTATYIAIGIMVTAMPLMFALFDSAGSNPKGGLGALLAAYYSEIALGFVAGCANQALFQRSPKQIWPVLGRILSMLVLFSISAWTSIWLAKLLEVRVLPALFVIGIVCGSKLLAVLSKSLPPDTEAH